MSFSSSNLPATLTPWITVKLFANGTKVDELDEKNIEELIIEKFKVKLEE